MDLKKALIVDDSGLARMMIRKIFSGNFPHWELLEAVNGEEALAKMTSEHIHLALIDFNMPGITGLELADALLKDNPTLPIYLVTANIQERMRLRAEALGIGFIKKPVSQEKIAEIIQHMDAPPQ